MDLNLLKGLVSAPGVLTLLRQEVNDQKLPDEEHCQVRALYSEARHWGQPPRNP